MSTINDTDQFLVQRNNSSFKTNASDLMSTIEDTDLMLIQRGAGSYKVTCEDVKEQLGTSTTGSIDTPVAVLTPFNGAGTNAGEPYQPLSTALTAVNAGGDVVYATDAIDSVSSTNNASTFYVYTSNAANATTPLTSLGQGSYSAATAFAEGATASWSGNKTAIVYENRVANSSWSIKFFASQDSTSTYDSFYESDDFANWTSLYVSPEDSTGRTTKRYIGYQSSYSNWTGATSCGRSANNPKTTLTFPTSNNFDKFEVGDVVQDGGWNQSQ